MIGAVQIVYFQDLQPHRTRISLRTVGLTFCGLVNASDLVVHNKIPHAGLNKSTHLITAGSPVLLRGRLCSTYHRQDVWL
ncbi:Uncharacterised protein [Bordetella pertussis]|nr:Uncharacterised protein [Bordetella pertussis]